MLLPLAGLRPPWRCTSATVEARLVTRTPYRLEDPEAFLRVFLFLHGVCRVAHTDSGEQAGHAGELPVTGRWLAIFEDRHGPGSFEQLRTLLGQPCVTFAEISVRFGVTRECVRQWHLLVMPDAPRGHARQRQCTVLRRRKRLLEDPLFRTFFRHARQHLARQRVELLRASDGYRTRSARIDNRLVALAAARRVAEDPGVAGAARYRLAPYRGPAEFLYFRLSEEDYLLVPAHLLERGRLVFQDADDSPQRPFKNSFAALDTPARPAIS